MKNKLLGFFLALFFITSPIIAQSSVEDYVKEGIQFHDQGDFNKAIELYNKALALDPKSPLVNYEIALSYFSLEDYKQVIKYSDVVLDQNSDLMVEAYLAKGSALDMIGKTKESIKLFEKAIKKEEPNYLLFYNLALNHYKVHDFDDAEANVVKAIEQNPNHSSSHLMLAYIYDQKGSSVQTLLATHYFLFLEPTTNRSLEAYQMLQENFGGNVSKDKDKPNTINISLVMGDDDDEFGAANLMVSLLEASKSLEKNEGKTEDEMFVENTQSFFKILGELKKKKNTGIWWEFYVPFFYDLAKSDHIETYCKYISQHSNEDSYTWLGENEKKLIDFDDWLKGN